MQGYGLTSGQLLYVIADLLAAANWQRTGKKNGKPKPVHVVLREAAEETARTERNAYTAEGVTAIFEYLEQFAPTADDDDDENGEVAD